MAAVTVMARPPPRVTRKAGAPMAAPPSHPPRAPSADKLRREATAIAAIRRSEGATSKARIGTSAKAAKVAARPARPGAAWHAVTA